jgi:hypothetical protein
MELDHPDYNGFVVYCHLCEKQTPTKETHTINIDSRSEILGFPGVTVSVQLICKECHRDHQLEKLIH